jgi:hypothetical protein
MKETIRKSLLAGFDKSRFSKRDPEQGLGITHLARPISSWQTTINCARRGNGNCP